MTNPLLDRMAEGASAEPVPDRDLLLLDRLSGFGIATWDPGRERLRAFASFRRMLPLAEQGLLQDLLELVHEADRERISAAMKEPSLRILCEARMRTGDGAFRWFALRGAPRRTEARSRLPWKRGKVEDGTGMVLLLEDIHARKEEEAGRGAALARAERLVREMSVLSELSQSLTTRLSLRDVLEETFQQASRLVDTTNFFIALYVPGKEEIHFVYDVTDSAQDKNELTIVPASRGVTGYIIRTKERVLIQESYAEWVQARGIPSLGEPALSWMGVPMMIGDRVLGVIAVQNYRIANLYDEHSLELLTSIASSTAIAIQNAQLFEERKQAEADLKQRGDRINQLVTPMLEALESTAGLIAQKKETLGQLARMTQESHEKLRLSDTNIKKVASSVDDMMEMVNIIGSISNTVNLLALNATIEAAHAGGLGRGFAVIAGEVRKLSDSTEVQAQDIAAALESMTRTTKESAQASGESFQTFSQMEEVTRDILAFLEEISGRMAQLSSVSEDILRSMEGGAA